jgi:chemotaxis protein MotB
MKRVRLRVAGESSSESYLESLSDLLVGLLFIFIIILMSFALNFRIAQDATKSTERNLSDAAQLRSNLLESMKASLLRQHIPIFIDKRNGVLRLPQSLLFAEGSADISDQGNTALGILAHRLDSILPCYALGNERRHACPSESHPIIDALFIEGHTDDIPISTDQFRDNWDLSAARSRSTYDALLKAAPHLTTIMNENHQPLLSISAYGDTRPVEGYKTQQETRRNSRRIDLRFVIAAPNVDDIHI